MKDQKGITLVALVVTIVVLLILAGVTVTYVLSDNGVFSNAKEASEDTNDAYIRDVLATAILEAQTEYYAAYADGNTYTASEGTILVNSRLTAAGISGSVTLSYLCDTTNGTAFASTTLKYGTTSLTVSLSKDAGFTYN